MLVRGGPANSGTKLSKTERRGAWVCTSGHQNRGFAVRCLQTGCNEKRPS